MTASDHRQRRRIVAVLVTLAALAPGPPAGSGAGTPRESEKTPSLERVLDGLARAAERYRGTPLGFTCRESIESIRYPSRHSTHRRFAYVFVRDGDSGLEDFRTRAGADSVEARTRELRPEEHGIPTYLRSALLWPFLFSESRQLHHRYELAGRRQVMGRQAIGVRFEPTEPWVEEINEWFGTAWVDPATWLLLRVEAVHATYWPRQRLLERALAGEDVPRLAHDIERVRTDFGLVEGGLRFPTEVELRRSEYRVTGPRKRPRQREERTIVVHQIYSDYRFYNVRTREAIERAIRADDADRSAHGP